jgi:hypothetical protein
MRTSECGAPIGPPQITARRDPYTSTASGAETFRAQSGQTKVMSMSPYPAQVVNEPVYVLAAVALLNHSQNMRHASS